MNSYPTPLFIFELANNHQGNLQHGLNIVEQMAKIARRYKIRAAVKLQYRSLETFIHPSQRNAGHKHIQRFLSTELSKADYETLVTAIHDQGLMSIVTPFDEQSVEDIIRHGVSVLKVASCSATDWPLLEAIAAAKKPIICSTGGLREEEIDQVVNFFEHRHCTDLSLLHCVGIYPTKGSQVQMHIMEWMMRRFHWLPVGWSGHEAPDNLDVVKVAVGKGARILERHVGIPTESSKLNAYSMNPEQTACWVEAALVAAEINGNPANSKFVEQDEIDSLMSLKRGVFAKKPIKKGEPIPPEDVFFAMPAEPGQTTTSEYQAAMVASQDYPELAPIHERRQRTTTTQLRSLIHQAKGMLYEAKILIGDRYSIEMSHHYGAENFRQTGALIVNLVNREYCKKLIIMLPGQRHPNHRHMKKEETFQLLHGDLEVDLNGVIHNLRPGQMVLVERGSWHAFTTVKGCIFEEVSTQHIIGDSYYEDSRIAGLDPMQRKTLLTMW